MTKNIHPMHRTPNIYDEGAEKLIAMIGMLIDKGTLKTRYTMEGVQVELPFPARGPVRIAFKDFEKIIQIFTEEPFGPAFEALRKLAVPYDDDQYLALVKKAVEQYFPFKNLPQ